jgi:hypothetical protein
MLIMGKDKYPLIARSGSRNPCTFPASILFVHGNNPSPDRKPYVPSSFYLLGTNETDQGQGRTPHHRGCRIYHFLSFPRKRDSSVYKGLWVPAFAGTTIKYPLATASIGAGPEFQKKTGRGMPDTNVFLQKGVKGIERDAYKHESSAQRRILYEHYQ